MKACPEGWHIPTMDEWQKLVDFLGGAEVATGKLKSTSDLWQSPNEGADNSSGFSALPAGFRKGWDDFAYEQLGTFATFWSSSPNNGELTYTFQFNSDFAKANLSSYGDNNNGYSVRCVKD